MIRIIADSTCDLSKSEAKKLGVDIIPISVRFGEKEYLDGVDITHKEFYEKLAVCNELPKTSQPSPAVFEEMMRKYVLQGDEVIGIFISSELSGTFQSALLAANSVSDDYDVQDKIFCVDSRNATIGTALIIREAVKMRDLGFSAKKISEKCTELAKHVKLHAVVGSLKYLKLGGRLSSAEAFAGTLLNITPVVSIEDGRVVVMGKARGKKAAEKLIIDKLANTDICLTKDFMYGHIDSKNALEAFILKSSSCISDISASVGVSNIGCSVGTHVGPGTYGVAYVEKYEEEEIKTSTKIA